MKTSRLLMALAAVVVAACTAPALAPSAPQSAVKAADDTDLVAVHEQFGKLDCKDCHGPLKPKSLPPEQELRLVNQSCIDCHGSMATVAAKIRPRLANRYINPHASHVVSIQCVTCHVAHDEPSKAYCQGCHSFDMPMRLTRLPGTH